MEDNQNCKYTLAKTDRHEFLNSLFVIRRPHQIQHVQSGKNLYGDASGIESK